MDEPPRKKITFLGGSAGLIRGFPESAKKDAGFQLDKVQQGLEPDDWEPMTTVGPGCREIRIWEEDGTYRVLYVAKFPEAVYVLNAFKKTMKKTPQANIDAAKAAYAQIPKPAAKGKGKK
ncbi:Phage-related protein [Variovorax sp. HW608]|uniref:type II toxin-antitoxin system RelE/ParE family toxin n=1 Tax=Variovorax sp. HW608 TaxID=1034889 RepID=UPI00081FA190|nr:type II toxin-antitoxin system RelE/ParE family toxin [Variovorax sp. HW608]SCK37110.1 Phage-related protein [Variovorax sp. HW608]